MPHEQEPHGESAKLHAQSQFRTGQKEQPIVEISNKDEKEEGGVWAPRRILQEQAEAGNEAEEADAIEEEEQIEAGPRDP